MCEYRAFEFYILLSCIYNTTSRVGDGVPNVTRVQVNNTKINIVNHARLVACHSRSRGFHTMGNFDEFPRIDCFPT